jgi:hypothetical protein
MAIRDCRYRQLVTYCDLVESLEGERKRRNSTFSFRWSKRTGSSRGDPGDLNIVASMGGICDDLVEGANSLSRALESRLMSPEPDGLYGGLFRCKT